MTEKLNVLVLESERRAADEVCDQLTQAGHVVLRCHEPGAPAFPCRGLTSGQRCPLDADVVDVAVDVRSRPRSQPAPTEDGMSCALRHRVPVVIAGNTVLNPFEDFDVSIVAPGEDPVGACERAAGSPLREHSTAAARVLRDVLDRRGLRAAPIVSVRRVKGALKVEVSGEPIDDRTKSMAAVRISGALREIDPHARGIDVLFHTA